MTRCSSCQRVVKPGVKIARLEYAAAEDLMHRADSRPGRFGVVTVWFVLLAMPLVGNQQPPATGPSQTRVVLLGTGTPAADPDQAGPATAIVVNDTAYLVDAGAGIVRRAALARRKGLEALEPTAEAPQREAP